MSDLAIFVVGFAIGSIESMLIMGGYIWLSLRQRAKP